MEGVAFIPLTAKQARRFDHLKDPDFRLKFVGPWTSEVQGVEEQTLFRATDPHVQFILEGETIKGFLGNGFPAVVVSKGVRFSWHAPTERSVERVVGASSVAAVLAFDDSSPFNSTDKH